MLYLDNFKFDILNLIYLKVKFIDLGSIIFIKFIIYRERKNDKLRKMAKIRRGGTTIRFQSPNSINLINITYCAVGRFSGSCSSIHFIIFYAELVICSGIRNFPLRIAWKSSLSVLPINLLI